MMLNILQVLKLANVASVTYDFSFYRLFMTYLTLIPDFIFT